MQGKQVSHVFKSPYMNKELVSITKGVFNPKRKNDCSVRAYAELHQISYEESEALFAKAGRVINKGASWDVLVGLFRAKGWKLTSVGSTGSAEFIKKFSDFHCEKGMTLKTLLKNPVYSKGKYAVLIHGHIFAMIDGLIYDKWEMAAGKRVTAIFSQRS